MAQALLRSVLALLSQVVLIPSILRSPSRPKSHDQWSTGQDLDIRMADQEDLFEHLEGASALETPSEYSFTQDSQVSSGALNGNGYANRSGEVGRRTAPKGPLDLDLDLDLAALGNLNLEDPELEANNGHMSREKRGARSDVATESDSDSAYNGGMLDDAYDLEEPAEELPPHACAYCGVHNTSCVVKCLICNKW